MKSKEEKQLTADKTLREEPTRPSALPSLAAARTHEEHYKRFSVGDMIVEETDVFLEQLSRNKLRFGIILSIHDDHTFSVRYVDGVDYTHASFCQPYGDWLREAKKKI
tara:strand:+ start:1846 stop:2169 length:324 start_codon:yes stop_codon:yes gene_type:complete